MSEAFMPLLVRSGSLVGVPFTFYTQQASPGALLCSATLYKSFFVYGYISNGGNQTYNWCIVTDGTIVDSLCSGGSRSSFSIQDGNLYFKSAYHYSTSASRSLMLTVA